MAYLVIDAGNTRVKVFVFEGDKVVFEDYLEAGTMKEKFLKIFKNFSISKSILSSVGDMSQKIRSIVEEKVPLIVLSSETKVPFQNNYQTPKTLGVDRIALMSAASMLFPLKNVLVIDAGTCITFDLINKENVYLGGAISMGLKMRYKSLHAFTEKLPELKFQDPDSLIGDSTKSSIHSGVVNGFVAEIKGIIAQYKQRFPNLTVVLTGGDMNYLSKRLKNGIFANPNFLVEGLNAILKYETQE